MAEANDGDAQMDDGVGVERLLPEDQQFDVAREGEGEA